MSCAEQLRDMIAAEGAIPISTYMGVANAHYYATRDPLGAAGDFTTAPEISQMFGELIGLWLADLWMRAGKARCHYVELGPGRGTLAVDALRAMRGAGLEPDVHLVETSRALRQAQAGRLPSARWHDDAGSLPGDAPLLIVANEFFDALPVRQLVKASDGWRERMVAWADESFVPAEGRSVPDGMIPAHLQAAPRGSIVETSPATAAIVGELASRLAAQGGAALIVDYGHLRTGTGDTLQALSRHAFASPWEEPGERDLTAHVDFEALAAAAKGVRIAGPVEQGAWLKALGIDLRADALSRAAPDRGPEIGAARDRLVEPDAMGSLFKVMALTAMDWPEPAAFPFPRG